MKKLHVAAVAAFIASAALLPIACVSDSDTGTGPESGTKGKLVVKLTDAPGLKDSVTSVDIFVVRVDARVAAADSAESDQDISSESAAAKGWITVATPNAAVNLMALQNGVATTLGEADLGAATYNGFRIIIDPVKSSVTLKSGTVLTGGSNPGIKFPSADKSGLKILLAAPVVIVPNTTTELLVDFDLENSFVIRGNSVHNNGLLFKPVIRASVTNLALTNARIRLVNATGSSLDLLQNGAILTGGGAIAFGAGSACSSVNATTPALAVALAGTTTPLAGFTPTFVAGNSFTVVAFNNATGGVQFITLANAFTPTAGMAGLRVFNATTATTGFDVYLTAVGAVLGGTPTFTNVAAGTGSAFISVPAGTSQLRLTTTALTTLLVDFGSQSFTAGQSMTLVIAPPATGSTTPRLFLIPNC